jgi:hypothetical protein
LSSGIQKFFAFSSPRSVKSILDVSPEFSSAAKGASVAANPVFVPRHDFLTVRQEKHNIIPVTGTPNGGLAVPDASSEASRWIVVDKGPDCKPGVEKGDIVVIGGYVPLGKNAFLLHEIPNGKNLFLVQDCNVIAVRKKGVE